MVSCRFFPSALLSNIGQFLVCMIRYPVHDVRDASIDLGTRVQLLGCDEDLARSPDAVAFGGVPVAHIRNLF